MKRSNFKILVKVNIKGSRLNYKSDFDFITNDYKGHIQGQRVIFQGQIA